MTMDLLKWRTHLLATIVAFLLVLPAVVFAGDGAASGPPGDEQAPAAEQADEGEKGSADTAEAAGQRPTLGQSSVAGQERTMPGGVLALATYILLWVFIFGFAFAILRRQRRLDAEIDALERRMDQVFETLE